MNAHPQIPKADTDTISEFLYMLFAPDFVHAFPDAWIEIVCIAPDKKLTWRFFSAHDLKPIIEYVVKMNAAGWNCYVGAALRHGEKPAEGERAKKKHLCAASHFWADCDAQGCYERAADILKRAQINPAMVHITGTTPNTRAQIWIKSAQPIASIAELEAATTALRDAFGSDNVQNADRIMRIAGTVNFPPPHKTERGYSVELTTLQIDRNVSSYSVESICELHPAAESAHENSSTNPLDNDGRANNRRGMDKVRELLASVRPGHWHISMRDVVAVMVGLQLSDAVIRTICTPYCAGGYDDPDLAKLIDTARAKFDKPNPDETGERWQRDKSDAAHKLAVDPVDLWGKFEPPSLPRGLLPDVLERFAHDQGMDMGADMSGIAMSALAVCAGAIPDNVKLQVKRHNTGWLESARLWVALVGPPSSKKTPIMTAAARPLRKIDAVQARDYADMRSVYEKLPKEEKLRTDPPKQVRSVLQDTTIEAAQDILKDSPDGLLCYQDELSGWFGAMDKYSAGRGSAKDRAFWLEAFNGGSYSVQRVGRGSVFIENLSISLVGGIQPEPIRQIADDSVDDGLLQRLLPITLTPAVAGRDEAASPVVAEYAELIGRLHGLAEATLRFDEVAQRYRQELEVRHLKLQSLERVHRKLGAHIGKYDGIFARLCVIWHCIENVAGFGEVPTTISEETAKRAGSFLHAFLLPHAIAFYTSVLGLSNDHDSITAVAGYILAHNLTKITNRDLKRGDRTMRRLGPDEALAAFEQLESFGWLDRVPSPLRGAPPHWLVNPAVHQKFAERAKSEAARRAEVRQTIVEVVGGAVEP